MPGTREIELSGGSVAIVDEEDYDRIVHMGRWWLPGNGYAICHQGRKKVRMHRAVNLTPTHAITDHINHNRLDNRKSNLRTVSHSENNQQLSYVKPKYPDLPQGITWDCHRNQYYATYKLRKRFANLDEAIKFTKEGR